MTAPAYTARQAPTGRKMDKGHGTVVAFASLPNVMFWEKEVQPPGYDGGDPIETFTMHNTRWRTKAPRDLIEMTEMSITAAYDPGLFDEDQALLLINVPDAITVHFAEGTRVAFYGYLKTFEPDSINESDQPEATLTIVATNTDPDTGDEEDPVVSETPGT